MEIGGAGRDGTAEGGATVWRGVPEITSVVNVDGRGEVAPWTDLCSTALRTSPGLEMCDKSILGRNSSAAAVARELPRTLPGSACSVKYRFTRSASSTSIELECVFFSVTPTLGRASRIALLLTSSSRARSLIRIFCMPPCFLRVVPSGYDFIASSRSKIPDPQHFPLALYLFSPGNSSSGMFSFTVSGRSCVVTSDTSASGASSTPSITSAS